MKKRLKLIGGGLTALLAMALLVVSPASASTLHNCPSGYSCMWKDASYKTAGSTQDMIKFQNKIPNFSSLSWASGTNANDNVSSIVNNGKISDVYYYEHANGGGKSLLVKKGDTAANLWFSTFNDQLSSAKFVGLAW